MAYSENCLENYKKAIGQKIRSLRLAAGFDTQEEFARAMEVDQPRIAKWESGRNRPEPASLKKLAKVLNVKISEFDLSVSPSAASSRSENIAALIALLPALDDLEVQTLRSQAENSPSLLKRRGTRTD